MDKKIKEKILFLLSFLEENLYNVNFSITTNGTLLTKEKVDFLKQNNFCLLFSFDGSKETQDYNRSDSFDTIIKNIPYLLEQFPNVVCRSTTYVDTISNLYKDYLFLNDCGFKYWNCGFDVSSKNWEEKDFNILEEELIKIINDNKELKMTNFSNVRKEKTTDIPLKYIIKCPYDRCGLGTVSQAIDYKGKIYSCHHAYDENSIFCIGDIYNGIDINKHKNLLELFTKSLINPVHCDFCEECNMQELCRFEYDGIIYCLTENYLVRHNFNAINSNICKISNLFFKYQKI